MAIHFYRTSIEFVSLNSHSKQYCKIAKNWSLHFTLNSLITAESPNLEHCYRNNSPQRSTRLTRPANWQPRESSAARKCKQLRKPTKSHGLINPREIQLNPGHNTRKKTLDNTVSIFIDFRSHLLNSNPTCNPRPFHINHAILLWRWLAWLALHAATMQMILRRKIPFHSPPMNYLQLLRWRTPNSDDFPPCRSPPV